MKSTARSSLQISTVCTLRRINDLSIFSSVFFFSTFFFSCTPLRTFSRFLRLFYHLTEKDVHARRFFSLSSRFQRKVRLTGINF